MSVDSPSPKTEDTNSENETMDVYELEKENTSKLNRSVLLLLGSLTAVSTAGFFGALMHRLSQFRERPDGSFPISHWLDTWMFIPAILSVVFFSSFVFVLNKIFSYKFQAQSVVTAIVASLLVLGSIAGVTKIMDTVWEANMKSWAMDRYGIEYETINRGWTPPVMGPGGCTSGYNPFAPNGLRNTTSCDIAVSGKDTYILVSQEGRYLAELLYAGNGYKAYKATVTPTPEELPVLHR